MKKTKKQRAKLKVSFRFLLGTVVYFLIIVVAAIFTQALRSPISAVVYSFTAAVPVVDLVCFLISWISLDVRVTEVSNVVSKGQPANVTVIIRNKGPISVPCAEISVSAPEEGSVLCKKNIAKTAVPAFTSVKTDIPASFRYCGAYTVGADEIAVYDFFRIFRLKKKISSETIITVLPNLIPSGGHASFGESGESSEKSASHNPIEFGDIRQYIPGDSVKSIHWKLSAKSEELHVRKYTEEGGKKAVVLCDFECGASGLELPKHYLAHIFDKVAEESLSTVRELISAEYVGRIVWKDSFALGKLSVTEFNNNESLTEISYRVSSAPREAIGSDEAMLVSELDDTFIVFVTAFASRSADEIIRSIIRKGGIGRSLVCLCDISELCASSEERERYLKDMDELYRCLLADGINVFVPKRNLGGEA